MSRGGYNPLERLADRVSPDHQPVGLIAGWGRFPVLIAETLVRNRVPVVCVAIIGHADPHLEYLCDEVHWSGVGRMSSHLRFFRRHGVRQMAMAGKLFKADLLYGGPVLLRHFPDWTCMRTFGPLLFSRRTNARDDSLLMAVTNMYLNHNIEVAAATELSPELLAQEGWLVGAAKSPKLQNDISWGWEVAKQMGSLDIGQSITVKDGTVLAVEAIEGTDACIERTGQLCRRGGWTLVKVAKPNQDMRFDVPTIGPRTIEKVADAGGAVIAIEAHRTIIVDRQETLALAEERGIAIVALDRERVRPAVAAAA